MRLWVWQHVRCELPDDWEMLQFSRRPEQGRCQFADRYQFRLELGWRKVAGPPDLDRTLNDYRSHLTAVLGMREVREVSLAGMRGLEGEAGGAWSTRFGHYLPKSQALIELVWLWPERPQHDLLQRALASVSEEPPTAGKAHWRAFGLDLRVPTALALQACNIAPGLAALTFADPRQPRRSERFDRLGMVKQWLYSPVADWLRTQAPRGLEERQTGCTTHAGHEVFSLAAWEPATVRDQVLRRRPRWVGRAWLCPHDGRLYCHRSQALVKRADQDAAAALPPVPLACCAAWGHAA